MLGKTHVVASTATLHAALVGYTVYATEPGKSPEFSFFGFTPGVALSTPAYLGVVVSVFLLVLLLLRVGEYRLFMGYGVGLFASLAMLYGLSDSDYPFQLVLFTLAFTLGSLLPDIDSEESTLGRYVPFVAAVIPHRTITHTFWMVAGLSALAYFTSSYWLVGLALGYALHIAQDSFSKQGICWFYPLIGTYVTYSRGGVMKKGRNTAFAYATGGTGELIVFIVSLVVHVICLVYMLNDVVVRLWV